MNKFNKISKSILHHFFTKKITLSKWQFNLIGVSFLTAGFVVGSYLTATEIILPKLFAADSPWVQTNWSGAQSDEIVTGTVTTYKEASNVDRTTAPGELTMSLASGWVNDYTSWNYRKEIVFDNTAANIGVAAENLTDFPILVKLEANTDIDYSKTKDSGEDIRFADSDGTALSYEIEEWNESGTSYVWVKVPQIDSESDTDKIYIYYGNGSADDGQNVGDVWSNNYAMVQHLKDATTSTVVDSTSNNYTGNKRTAAAPLEIDGKIGKAQDFGSSDYIDLDNILNPGTNDMTIEIWFKRITNGSTNSSILYNKESLWEASAGGANGGYVTYAWVPHWVWDGGTSTSVTLNEWQRSTVVYNHSQQIMYKNGLQSYSRNQTGNIGTNTSRLQIGARGNTGHSSFFYGQIDEMRVSFTARSAAWLAASYKSDADEFNTFGSEEAKYASSGYLVSNVFDAGFPADWGTLVYTTAGEGNVTVKVRSSDTSTMSTDWSTCSGIASGSDLTGDCVTDTHEYIQYRVELEPSGANTPTFEDISLAFIPSDQDPPEVNATEVAMSGVSNGNWVKTAPIVSWTAGLDDGEGEAGNNILGYCLSLDETEVDGDPPNNDPSSSSGNLGTNAVHESCDYIATSTSINLATVSTISLTSNKQYYLSVKAIDNYGNIYTGTSETWQNLVNFKYDATNPTNISYILTPQGNFSNVIDMSFSWPSGSLDNESGLLGWQYQLNSTTGSWQGTTHSDDLDLDYIPATASSHQLIEERDGENIVSGANIVYFKAIDNVGNSSTGQIRTGNLNYGGAAPNFAGGSIVTVTPSDSDSNYFELSWPEATASDENNIAAYYYMINASPPSTYSTLNSNASTYMSNGTATSVEAAALSNVNQGNNTVYVVAVDDADTPNYSPSNYISGTFTLNSTDPDNVGNLLASDSSIKAQSQWNVALTWTAPDYQGAGNLTYLIYRSTDGETFTQVGSTSSLSYVDNTPESTLYYYKVYTQDDADASSSGTNAVTITPTGKWTTAPSLESGPTTSSITTKKATVAWSTSRTADSKVSYGTASGEYFSEEVSNSSQVTSHSLTLTNLTPGTTYYYKAKWTDEDGNNGESDENTFTTEAAPTAKEVSATNISLASAIIEFTSTNATKAKIYYGQTTGFGGLKEVSVASSETTYTVQLTGLEDGTKYYFKVNLLDSESTEYEGDVYSFQTLPRPKVSNVRIQQVLGTAQPTVLVTWTSNTEISSIVTYYPSNNPSLARDEVNVTLAKGTHRMIIRGLQTQTTYALVVKGRDKAGNEAISDVQKFTTATDTRPPQISDLLIEGSTSTNTSGEQSNAQLVVTWNTDEPATSQVEFGEGTGDGYAQKTQEDSSLTFNHIVVISGLTPSKVYHLRAVSKDSAGNNGTSIDTVTITPKLTDNALNLVITNLQGVFGFLGGFKQ